MSGSITARDFIADKAGCVMAEYRNAWRRGRVAWLTEDSPRNLAALSSVRLVPLAHGATSAEVRVIAGEP